jgi:signal transduction histidine kinase
MPQPRRDLVFWLAAVALVLVVVGTLGANLHADAQGEIPGPVVLGVLLAGGALLPALLPVPAALALAVGGVLTGVYFAAGYGDGPVFLAVPTLTLVHASRLAPRRWVTAALLATVAGVAGLWLRHVLHDADRSPSLWQAVGLTALVAAAGAVGAAGRSRRAAAAERARSVASEERLRMAADLHDGVGHGLAVIAMQAGAALHVLDRDTDAARASLEAIRSTSKESLDLLRSQLARLSEQVDAPRTPVPGTADLSALVARVRAGGLAVDLHVDPHVDLLDDLLDGRDEAARAVYGVVQEGLTNVLRHAAASHAAVTVHSTPEGLVVTVEDDGHGPAAGGAGAGLGLVGMRSRVEALGGTLEAGPAAAGFRVRARIPLQTGVAS